MPDQFMEDYKRDVVEGLIADVEDLLVDLVGTFNDARSLGETGIHSAIGSRFEMRVRACADTLQALSERRDAVGENARLRAALQTIADMAPATAEMTLAHAMAQEAESALAVQS